MCSPSGTKFQPVHHEHLFLFHKSRQTHSSFTMLYVNLADDLLLVPVSAIANTPANNNTKHSQSKEVKNISFNIKPNSTLKYLYAYHMPQMEHITILWTIFVYCTLTSGSNSWPRLSPNLFGTFRNIWGIPFMNSALLNFQPSLSRGGQEANNVGC